MSACLKITHLERLRETEKEFVFLSDRGPQLLDTVATLQKVRTFSCSGLRSEVRVARGRAPLVTLF